MTDRRLLAANASVAASELRGVIDAPRFVDGTWHRITVPVTDLLRAPHGARDRQVVYGQRVRVFDSSDDMAFVQSERDGYVGYVAAATLGDDATPTHQVVVPSTHLYPAADLKQHETTWLSHGSRLTISGASADYAQTDSGHFVPAQHIAPIEHPADEPIKVASLFLGTPYLWGGNSRLGIDCSGLVQAAFLACGHPCPGDSDLQQDALGSKIPETAPILRGDLFFWKGHVAMAVDEQTLIHANAHHMAVAQEPLAPALARIASTDTGPVTARRRVAL